jgi:hypothetical protein
LEAEKEDQRREKQEAELRTWKKEEETKHEPNESPAKGKWDEIWCQVPTPFP